MYDGKNISCIVCQLAQLPVCEIEYDFLILLKRVIHAFLGQSPPFSYLLQSHIPFSSMLTGRSLSTYSFPLWGKCRRRRRKGSSFPAPASSPRSASQLGGGGREAAGRGPRHPRLPRLLVKPPTLGEVAAKRPEGVLVTRARRRPPVPSPMGGRSARKTVRWTVFSVGRAAAPDGGPRQRWMRSFSSSLPNGLRGSRPLAGPSLPRTAALREVRRLSYRVSQSPAVQCRGSLCVPSPLSSLFTLHSF